VIGLGALAALLARKRTRPVLLAVGVLLPGARASAQAGGVPTFELELLKLNPSGTGSLLLGTGELLPAGGHRLSLTTHYENDPLVLFLSGEKMGAVVQHRATAHLAAAYGLWGWAELGAQLPVLLFQRGDDLTRYGVVRPEGGLTAGTPLFTLRVKLLAEREEDPVDLSLGVHAGPSVGNGAALARELRAIPSLMAGRRFGLLRAAIDAGVMFRRRTILSPDANVQDEIGHALRLGATLSSLGEGLRGEAAVLGSVPFKREGSSIETLAGARWPVSDSFEAYGLAGLAFGNAPGTPDFRVLLGMAYGRARPPSAGSIQQAPVPDPLELPDPPGQDGKAVPEKDSDGDDILDGNDACPSEAGIPEVHGCPARDTDQDTVQDHLDNCPEVAGPAGNQGCPAEEKQLVAIQKDRIEIKDTVHFDFDKATIQPRSFPLLDQVARILIEHPEILSVTIEGHTDERGSAEYNRDLSQRRSEAVRDYLAQKGVSRERMEARGFGEDRPVQSNGTDEGRAANRRVEFITRYTQAEP
jgi:outer membrane protein OmpA-like peptidoglycan-associated protein